MLYIKITRTADGGILGAEAIKEPFYVAYQAKNKIIITVPEYKATGIAAADGSCYYQLKGRAALIGAAAGMEAEEIDEWTYKEIIESLPDPEPQPDPEPEQPDAPMTPAQMRLRLIELSETVERLNNEQQIIKGAVLEMSEEVYQ